MLHLHTRGLGLDDGPNFGAADVEVFIGRWMSNAKQRGTSMSNFKNGSGGNVFVVALKDFNLLRGVSGRDGELALHAISSLS